MTTHGSSRLSMLCTFCLGLAACTLSACDSEKTAPAAEQKAQPVGNAGQKLFAARCGVCHGPRGAGDGPGAAALDPKPRDLGDPTWGPSVTDEHIRKIIVEGGVAVGKSPAMPPAPDLKNDPTKLDALVGYVRSLAR